MPLDAVTLEGRVHERLGIPARCRFGAGCKDRSQHVLLDLARSHLAQDDLGSPPVLSLRGRDQARHHQRHNDTRSQSRPHGSSLRPGSRLMPPRSVATSSLTRPRVVYFRQPLRRPPDRIAPGWPASARLSSEQGQDRPRLNVIKTGRRTARAAAARTPGRGVGSRRGRRGEGASRAHRGSARSPRRPRPHRPDASAPARPRGAGRSPGSRHRARSAPNSRGHSRS